MGSRQQRLWRAALVRKPRPLGETQDAGYWDVEPRDAARSFRPPAAPSARAPFTPLPRRSSGPSFGSAQRPEHQLKLPRRPLDEPDELLRKLRIRVLRRDEQAVKRFLSAPSVYAAVRRGVRSREDRSAWAAVALSVLLDEVAPGDRRHLVGELERGMRERLGTQPSIEWYRRIILLHQRNGEPFEALEVVNLHIVQPGAADYAAVSVASARAARRACDFVPAEEIDKAMQMKGVGHSVWSQTAQLGLMAATSVTKRQEYSWKSVKTRIDALLGDGCRVDRMVLQAGSRALAASKDASGEDVARQFMRLLGQAGVLPPNSLALYPVVTAFDSTLQGLQFLRHVPPNIPWCPRTGAYAMDAAHRIDGEAEDTAASQHQGCESWVEWVLRETTVRVMVPRTGRGVELGEDWQVFFDAAARASGGTLSGEEFAAAWKLRELSAADAAAAVRRGGRRNGHRAGGGPQARKNRSTLAYRRRAAPLEQAPWGAEAELESEVKSLSLGEKA